MTAVTAVPPLNRREYAYATFLASFLLFAILLCGGIGWAMNTPRILIDLGSPENYSLEKPNRVNLNLKDGTSRTVWLVYDESEWIALDGVARAGKYWQCKYVWVSVNNRFQDPCSGYRWTRSGILLSYQQWSNAPLHDLDRYSLAIQQDKLIVDVTNLIQGTIRTSPADGLVCSTEPRWAWDCGEPTLTP